MSLKKCVAKLFYAAVKFDHKNKLTSSKSFVIFTKRHNAQLDSSRDVLQPN